MSSKAIIESGVTLKLLSEASLIEDAKAEGILLAELGWRVQLVSAKPETAGLIEINFEGEREGFGNVLREIGQRVYKRVTHELFDLVCGRHESDQRDRDEIKKAFGFGEEAVAGALVAVMVSGLGVSPILAPVIAVLVVRRVIAPTYEEACGVWEDALSEKEN